MPVSTQPYKGVRDFYPEDKRVQNYIFDVWRKTCESFGYVEYDASVLEPAELYESKTSEEIVNERGDRRVTLRPEMTPTLARMVAARKRDLAFPVRWYSVPNMFRYERPQRGRLREHWQLNADILGSDSLDAEVELISLAVSILDAFGLQRELYEVRVNDRRLLQEVFEKTLTNPEDLSRAMRLLDRSEKDKAADEELRSLLKTPEDISFDMNDSLKTLISKLETRGISNAVFSATLVRGFDYYSGIVFEIFDKHPDNNRAIFGGGRYDNLLELFGEDRVPAVGFGMGDVSLKDVLETYGLLPDFPSTTHLYVVCVSQDVRSDAERVADGLRKQGLNIAVDFTDRKVGDQIKKADKDKIPYVLIVGPDEIASGVFTLKDLQSGEEKKVALADLPSTIRS
jgi:histidyl-tRNA synthetase